jgi:predicted dehydrogenase
LDIFGENGSAVLEDDRLVRWAFIDEDKDDAKIRHAGKLGDDLKSGHADPKAIPHEGHRRLLEDFAAAIQAGKEPMIPGRQGIEAIRLIDGIYQSSRTGKPFEFHRARQGDR